MRGIEELERALADLAATAPDGVGVMDAVKADASRIRQRRRIVSISAVSAVLVVAIAGAPAAVSGLGQRAPDTAAAGYRDPLQLTVDLAPNDRYFKLNYATSGSVQRVVVRSNVIGPIADNIPTKIIVHDPGAYDANHLLRGERVTVQGHTAYYVPDLPMGTGTVLDSSASPGPALATREMRSHAVGWQDPSGAWVLVVAEITPPNPKEALTRFAELVQTGGPRDILTPFNLSHIPDNLQPTGIEISESRSPENDAYIGFGAGAKPPSMHGMDPRLEEHPLTIRMVARNSYLDSHTADLGTTRRIAGYDVWYATQAAGWAIPDNGSVLAFNVDQCVVLIAVADRDRITLAELTRMLEGARFSDCTDPATWVRPVS